MSLKQEADKTAQELSATAAKLTEVMAAAAASAAQEKCDAILSYGNSRNIHGCGFVDF